MNIKELLLVIVLMPLIAKAVAYPYVATSGASLGVWTADLDAAVSASRSSGLPIILCTVHNCDHGCAALLTNIPSELASKSYLVCFNKDSGYPGYRADFLALFQRFALNGVYGQAVLLYGGRRAGEIAKKYGDTHSIAMASLVAKIQCDYSACVENGSRNVFFSSQDCSATVAQGKLAFISSSSAPWQISGESGIYDNEYYSTGLSVRSGLISDGGSSWLETTVTGPGLVSFNWFVSSEKNYDGLSFFVDGVCRDTISGEHIFSEHDWAMGEFPIAEGSHKLRWEYKKDSSVSKGLDGAWIADVVWIKKQDSFTSYRTSFSSHDITGHSLLYPVVMDPGGATGDQRLYEGLPIGDYSAPTCPYSREGYRFAGWNYYSACYKGDVSFSCKGIDCGGLVGLRQAGSMLDICGLSALVATWEPIASYTVTFNANGGSCSTSSKQYSSGSTLGTLPTATRNGYAFDGWYTSSSGGTKVTSSTTVTKAVTYYAHWTKVVTYCEVAFDVNGGEGGTTWREVETGKSVGTLPSPVRSKHKFLGWYTQRDGGTKVSASTKVTTDVIYYAHWQYDGSTYVAISVAEGCEEMGTVSGGNKSVKGGSKVTLKATAKKGYAFVGWFVGDEPVSAEASYSHVVGEDEPLLVARFIAAEDDYLELASDGECYDDVNIPLNEWNRFIAYYGSAPTVKVTGLPTGVKFRLEYDAASDDESCVLIIPYGTPTKAGIYYPVCTVKNGNGYVCSETFKWVIGNPADPDYNDTGLDLEAFNDWGIYTGLDFYWNNNGGAVPVGIGAPTITKISASGLPAGLKLQQVSGYGMTWWEISGVPTKAGKFKVSLTVTYSNKKTAKTVKTFVVHDSGSRYFHVGVGLDSEGCGTVTGSGVYVVGAKAKLTAKANKGYVFAGWYAEDGERVYMDSGEWRKPSDGYLTSAGDNPYNIEWPHIYARFVPQEEDRNVSINSEEEWLVQVNDWGGAYSTFYFGVDSASLPTVTVSGLPSGCKFDKGNMRLVFEKQPQKPGISKVTIKAKNVSGVMDERVLYVKVPNLRSDVFDGIDYDRDYRVPQYDSMVCDDCWLSFDAQPGWTVTASGLPSGLKLVKDDYEYSAMKVVGTATKDGAYTVTLTAKRGSVSEKATFTIIVDPLPSYAIGTFNGVLLDEWGVETIGTFTMTATSSGKLSATLIARDGAKYTYSANTWECIANGECYAHFSKKVKSNCWDGYQYISVCVRNDSGWDGNQLSGHFLIDACVKGGEGIIAAQRNPFGKVGKDYENWEAHSIAATLAGYGKMGVFVFGLGYDEYELACPNCVDWSWGIPNPDLTFTVAVDGTVKVAGKIAGKSVSGSSKLRIIDGAPQADFMFSVGKTPISIHVGFELGYGANGAAYGSARVGW